jgi:hypothetical protein
MNSAKVWCMVSITLIPWWHAVLGQSGSHGVQIGQHSRS